MGNLKARHYTVPELLKIKRDAVGEAMDRATLCCLLTLRDEFGFGEKRMVKFLEALDKTVICNCEKRMSLKDVQQAITEETGLKFQNGFLERSYVK